MNDGQVAINMPDELVRPIIEKKIQAGIISALGDTDSLIEGLVGAALRDKVSQNGKKSDYSRDNKFDLVDVLCREAIENAIREAMAEWVKENSGKLKEAVKKQIQKRPAGFAKMFVDGIFTSLESRWMFTVNVQTQKD